MFIARLPFSPRLLVQTAVFGFCVTDCSSAVQTRMPLVPVLIYSDCWPPDAGDLGCVHVEVRQGGRLIAIDEVGCGAVRCDFEAGYGFGTHLNDGRLGKPLVAHCLPADAGAVEVFACLPGFQTQAVTETTPQLLATGVNDRYVMFARCDPTQPRFSRQAFDPVVLLVGGAPAADAGSCAQLGVDSGLEFAFPCPCEDTSRP